MAKVTTPKQAKFGKHVKPNGLKMTKVSGKKRVKESVVKTPEEKRKELLYDVIQAMVDGKEKVSTASLKEYVTLRTRGILEELNSDEECCDDDDDVLAKTKKKLDALDDGSGEPEDDFEDDEFGSGSGESDEDDDFKDEDDDDFEGSGEPEDDFEDDDFEDEDKTKVFKKK